MITLRTGEDTKFLHWGKYNRPMAVYLYDLILDGGEDDWAGNADMGESVYRVGRWLVFFDSQGFVTAHKCADVEEAIDAFEHESSYYDDTEE